MEIDKKINKHLRVKTIIQHSGQPAFDIEVNYALKQLEDNGFEIQDIKYHTQDSDVLFYFSAMIMYYKID